MASTIGLVSFCDFESILPQKIVNFNGDEFNGSLTDGLRQGSGVMNYKNGNTFSGDWKEGKRHGQGIYKDVKSWNYKLLNFTSIIHFKDLLCKKLDKVPWFTGRFIVPFSNLDTTYTGHFENDQYHGYGILTKTSDGSVLYEGEWKHGDFHGKGKLYMTCGNNKLQTYTGDFVKGKCEGYGTLIGVQGEVYVGQFREDKFNGHGQLTQVNGNVYEGRWRAGNMHGSGVYKYACGDSYVGKFYANKKHGHGVYKWQNVVENHPLCGHEFEGDWVRDKRNGRGIMKNKDGVVIFDGAFKDDKEM